MRALGAAASHGASGLQSRVTNVLGREGYKALETYVDSSMQSRDSVIMHGCIVDILTLCQCDTRCKAPACTQVDIQAFTCGYLI